MKKRIFVLMLSCLIAATSMFGVFADNETEGTQADKVYYNQKLAKVSEEYRFELIAKNDRIELYCDKTAAVIAVYDDATGETWYSAPPVDIKTEVTGETISAAKSMMYVTFTNSSKIVKHVYSAMDNEVSFETSNLTNGIRFDYDFHKYKFSIPVTFVLTDDGVEASILLSEIKEYGDNTINDIDFLKYFGAVQDGTEGYMVIPDGSGAIVKFDNGKNTTELNYNKPFYGIDAAELTTKVVETSRNEKVTLPVGGLVRGEMPIQDDTPLTPLYNINLTLEDSVKAAEDAIKDVEKTLKKFDKAEGEEVAELRTKAAEELKIAVDAVNQVISDKNLAVDEMLKLSGDFADRAVAVLDTLNKDVRDLVADLNTMKATATENGVAVPEDTGADAAGKYAYDAFVKLLKEAIAAAGEARTAAEAAVAAYAAANDDQALRDKAVTELKNVAQATDLVVKYKELVDAEKDLLTDKQAEEIKAAHDALTLSVTDAKSKRSAVVTAGRKQGLDATDDVSSNTDDAENPSYGFLFEVTSGAENASLRANVSGNKLIGDFNNIYTNVVYRTNYNVPLKGQAADTEVLYNAEDPISTETYTVAYHFSPSDKTDYMTLAQIYRDVLNERGWLTDDDVTENFYLELFGAVNKKKSFAGLVYTTRETLTTFNEAKAIMQELQEKGNVSNLHVLYSNFSDDFFEGDMEIAIDPSGSLGGLEDLKSLLEYAKSISSDVALSADFQSFHSGGNGVSTFWDTADVINVSPIKVYPFALNANTMDTAEKPYYLLDPTMYTETVDTLLESVSENGYSALYFDEEAVQLYSDLAPDGYQAERTSVAQAEQYDRLQAAGIEITMSNPNAYLYPYVDYLVDIPVCSSKEILFDEDIPFVQAVLRGEKNFAGESMNITDVSDESFLRHLEYGTDMKYSLINAETKVLLKTDMTDLYSASYDTFKDQIIERYAAFKEFGTKVGDAAMIAHERMNNGDVAITTYGEYDAQGNEIKVATVYVNYGEEAVTIGDVTVEAMGYVIV